MNYVHSKDISEKLGDEKNPVLSKSIVFIPNKTNNKPGHYVVLEDKT